MHALPMQGMRGAPMILLLVVDVGCHECGVGHEVVGTFTTREAAESAQRKRNEETKMWRDGGQTFAEVLEVPEPEA